MIQISNDQIAVEISLTGGELQSIRDRETGLEYLWQGDKSYWGKRAINLFPFVGRHYKETYMIQGRSYPAHIHGFLPHAEMELVSSGGSNCILMLKDSNETREVYPYAFHLYMIYELEGRCLKIEFKVINNSQEIMYFGMGGHPGFRLPLEENLSFEDYRIEFLEECIPNQVVFSPSVLDTGIRKAYPLLDKKYLPLKHELFTADAIVFQDMPRKVVLSSEKGRRKVQVDFPQMPYVGFWHKPNTDAPFVCIEPWACLPGREGITEELGTMKDMTAVEPGRITSNKWSITVW